MITQALQVLIFGMVGIFIVMGIIIGVITLLGKIGSGANKEKS
jgi:hypothetical protein